MSGAYRFTRGRDGKWRVMVEFTAEDCFFIADHLPARDDAHDEFWSWAVELSERNDKDER